MGERNERSRFGFSPEWKSELREKRGCVSAAYRRPTDILHSRNVSANRKATRHSREASKIAADKSLRKLYVSWRARGDVAPYTYHNCKMCLLRDMQEMISTVKLDDRATAACGSKNGRYELPRLSTSVKDNLWPNKSVTGSRRPSCLAPFTPRYKDLGAFFIESTRLPPADLVALSLVLQIAAKLRSDYFLAVDTKFALWKQNRWIRNVLSRDEMCACLCSRVYTHARVRSRIRA